jgi:predicted ribosome quality control (RQC) complex YloA/Tae2 family protein
MAELSGFEVATLVKEISNGLRRAYVNNIFSYGDAQIIRLRRPEGEDGFVVLSPRHGAWVSEKIAERAETSGFTSKLRSALARLRLEGASQPDMDRIFDLEFGEGDSVRHLLLELMPPGNIVVTDALGRVLLCLREVRARGRVVSRGVAYSPPKQSRPSPESADAGALERALRSESTAGRAIGRHISIPRRYVRELLARCGVAEEEPAGGLVPKSAEIASQLKAMVSEARSSPRPSLRRTPEGAEIFAIAPRSATEVEDASTVSALCDEVLLPLMVRDNTTPSEGDTEREELLARVRKLGEEADGLRARASELRVAAKKAEGSPNLEEAQALMDGLIPRRAGARGAASPSAAASALYDEAKRMQNSAAEVDAALERLSKKAKRSATARTASKARLSRTRKEWYERFRWFVTSGGRLAVGGRDAHSNSLLVGKHAEADDTVFHADLFGSPFFVLKGGKSQTESEALETAQATVCFSSGWKTGLGAADAYWVDPGQVSATPESGEYLPKGSFVIRGKKNFVRHILLQVAVGIDGEGRVVSGPEPAISKTARCYLVLAPHREKPSDTAKKVKRELERLLGDESPAALDEFVRALPSGGGKIVRKVAPEGAR